MSKLFEIIEKITRLSQNMDDVNEKFSSLEKDLMLKYIAEMHDHVTEFEVKDELAKENISIDIKDNGMGVERKVTPEEIVGEVIEEDQVMSKPEKVESVEVTDDRIEVESTEINELVKTESRSLNDIHTIKESEVNEVSLDLNKKIGFINELFGGDSIEFEKMIARVQKFDSLDEMQSMVETTMNNYKGWTENPETASQFLSYIRQIVRPGSMRVAK